MVLTAAWVPYGREAADALRGAVADAKAGEPLAPVTVVVPSNHVGVAARRLLASGALGPVTPRGVGLAAVTFVTVYRLAELVGAPALAGAGRRPVSTPVIAAAVRAALADDPGPFAPVAAHPATEAALVDAYRELRDLSPAGLAAIAATSRRARAVVAVHGAVRRRLEHAWYDEQDLMASATATLADRPHPDVGALVVHLPQRLSRPATDVLVAAAHHAPVAVLAGTSGDERADADVARTLTRLGVALEQPAPAPLPVAEGRTSIVTSSDADDEVREAVRAVVDAVRAGTPLDRIAVLHPGAEPYARLCHEHLGAAGVASNGPAVAPLATRVAGRALLRLLALPDRGFRRQDVLAWIASAPLHHQGRDVPATAWERISRDAAVVGGRRDWDERLRQLAEDHAARAERAGAEERGEPAVERARRDAAQTAALRDFVLGVIDALGASADRRRPWGEHASWARRLAERLLGGPHARDDWPVEERRAAERVDRALDRLAALGSIEGPVGLDVFTRTLELELEADLGRAGRFGDGVLVGPVSMGIGLDLDLVVVLGLAEGTFPSVVRDDSLLPDHERQAAGDDIPLRRDGVDRQHRELRAVLAGARRQVLCVPRGDLRRSTERVPARWVLDAATAVAGTRWWTPDLLAGTAPWLTHVASFDAGLRTLAEPATDQEHRLRALMADADAVIATDPLLAAGAEVVAARRSEMFTRFDGNVAGVAVPSPAERVTSATALERWACCPHAYLVGDVLGVREVEHPEDELRITALGRGSLVHQVLERFVTDTLDRSGPPGPDEPWSPVDRLRLLDVAHDLFATYQARGLTGRPLFWQRDKIDIEADLVEFLDADSVQRSLTRTRPLAAELAFGFGDDGTDSVAIALPDGRQVRFRGQADRVDVADDGTLHVLDYKTGRSAPYAKLSEEDPTSGGTRLQLTVYGQAARARDGRPEAPVVAAYWFVSAKGGFTRKGYPVTDAVLAHVSEALGRIVKGIEGGVFPSHPTAKATTPFVECAYCDPDGLGVADLRRQWERKRADPVLAAYADVVEPLAPDTEVGAGDG